MKLIRHQFVVQMTSQLKVRTNKNKKVLINNELTIGSCIAISTLLTLLLRVKQLTVAPNNMRNLFKGH